MLISVSISLYDSYTEGDIEGDIEGGNKLKQLSQEFDSITSNRFLA